MGVWIETSKTCWAARLKSVTPHVGVWIETGHIKYTAKEHGVTPHVGVWIETSRGDGRTSHHESLPMWECGLKLKQSL